MSVACEDIISAIKTICAAIAKEAVIAGAAKHKVIAVLTKNGIKKNKGRSFTAALL